MRLLGHPAHPMLVHFPVACWSLGTACDLIAVTGFERVWVEAALLLGVGLVTALPAALAGLIDFAALPEKSVRAGTLHMMLMATAWLLYLAAMLSRSKGWALAGAVEWVPVCLSVLGFLVMAVGGYYGGELVYRFGAGVRKSTSTPE